MTERSKRLIIAATAFALGITVGLSSVVIIKRNVKPLTVVKASGIDSAVNYNSVYKVMKKFVPTVWDNITSKISAYNGAKMSEYTNGTDESAKAYIDAADVDYSETNVQVQGVDEADIVKTDGKYIYILKIEHKKDGITLDSVIKIVNITGEKPVQCKSITLEGFCADDMYLSGKRLVIIGRESALINYSKALNDDIAFSENCSSAVFYDVSDPQEPEKSAECAQSGSLSETRLIDGKLYIISNYYINTEKIEKDKPETFVPSVTAKNHSGAVNAGSICFYGNCSEPEYTVLSAYDIKDGKLLSTQSVLGGSYTVYASSKNIITASLSGGDGKLQVTRFSLNGGDITLEAAGELEGELLNQFSIDEYKEHFRFVLTDNRGEYSSNSLVILDGNLKKTGAISGIAEDERVYSVRFMGDTAYFVTFRQVDPLFSVDVSDPTSPKIIGSLKIPGFSNYLFPFGKGMLFGMGQNADEKTGRSTGMKISMFDISDPSNVTECAKTNISASYSEALYSHKATLINSGKNIIGFSAYGWQNNILYFIYAYEKGELVKKAEINLPHSNTGCRGLYSGDKFYVVTPDVVYCFTLDGFKELSVTEI